MPMGRALPVVAFALSAVVARADEVFVKGGGRLSGQVIEYGPDTVVVDVGPGQIGLPLSYVERIVPGTTPQAVYRERAARLAAGDAAGWVALGQWALEQDLLTKARAAFEHVLGVDPSNAAAHLGLGHVRVGDQWMTQEDGYRARGLVVYQGSWMTRDEQRTLVDERLAAAEEERVRLEADARVREAEARARVAEAEAARADAELRRPAAPASGLDYPGFPYPGFGYPAFGYPGFVVGGYSPWFAVHARAHFRRRCEFGNCWGAFAPRFAHPMGAPLVVPPARHPGPPPGRR